MLMTLKSWLGATRHDDDVAIWWWERWDRQQPAWLLGLKLGTVCARRVHRRAARHKIIFIFKRYLDHRTQRDETFVFTRKFSTDVYTFRLLTFVSSSIWTVDLHIKQIYMWENWLVFCVSKHNSCLMRIFFSMKTSTMIKFTSLCNFNIFLFTACVRSYSFILDWWNFMRQWLSSDFLELPKKIIINFCNPNNTKKYDY